MGRRAPVSLANVTYSDDDLTSTSSDVPDDGMVEDAGPEAIADAPLDDTGDPTETGANRDPGADLDSQGIPTYAESYQPGDPDAPGMTPEPIQPPVPTDEPTASLDWGTTVDEQRRGEPMDLKLAREEPDVQPPFEEVERGSVVQPDEGAHTDVEKDEVGSLVERPESQLPAEEAAIHVEPER